VGGDDDAIAVGVFSREREERADTSRLASVETPLARGAVWLT
jgi:hypothetical protein